MVMSMKHSVVCSNCKETIIPCNDIDEALKIEEGKKLSKCCEVEFEYAGLRPVNQLKEYSLLDMLPPEQKKIVEEIQKEELNETNNFNLEMLKVKVKSDGNSFEILNEGEIFSFGELEELIGKDNARELAMYCEFDYRYDDDKTFTPEGSMEETIEQLNNRYGIELIGDLPEIDESELLIFCFDRTVEDDGVFVAIASKKYFEDNGYLNDHYTTTERSFVRKLQQNLPISEIMESIFEVDDGFDENTIRQMLENAGVQYSNKLNNFINS